MGTDGGAQGRVTAADERGQAALEGRPLEQEVAAAGLAAKPDVRTEPIDQPRVAAARMGAAKAHDIAQVQLDGGA